MAQYYTSQAVEETCNHENWQEHTVGGTYEYESGCHAHQYPLYKSLSMKRSMASHLARILWELNSCKINIFV